MTPDETRALVRRHIDVGFNRGDWSVCETTLADDYTARYGAEGKANVGRDHYVRVCKMLRNSFPDVAITIEELIVEGDSVVNRYVERGTLTGATFVGIEAAGQRAARPAERLPVAAGVPVQAVLNAGGWSHRSPDRRGAATWVPSKSASVLMRNRPSRAVACAISSRRAS
jgi:predicted ester cyclase